MQKCYVYLFGIDEKEHWSFFCPQKKVHFITHGSILFKKRLLCVLQHIFEGRFIMLSFGSVCSNH